MKRQTYTAGDRVIINGMRDNGRWIPAVVVEPDHRMRACNRRGYTYWLRVRVAGDVGLTLVANRRDRVRLQE